MLVLLFAYQLTDQGAHHERRYGPSDQIPIVGQRERQNGLKLEVNNIALRFVEPISIFLKPGAPRCSKSGSRVPY
jgi:hypothetical protein